MNNDQLNEAAAKCARSICCLLFRNWIAATSDQLESVATMIKEVVISDRGEREEKENQSAD